MSSSLDARLSAAADRNTDLNNVTISNNPEFSTPTASQQAQAQAQSFQAHASSAQAQAHTQAQQASVQAQQAKVQAQDQANQAKAKLSEASHTANQKIHEFGESAANHPLVKNAQQSGREQLNVLDRQLARYGFLNEFEARTRIPKTYGFLGFSITTALLILLNLFGLAQPITNLIGWAVPAYLTIHALESPQKGDDAQWLCYWIVFGFLNYLESAALRVVLYYVPHYFTLKLAATVWLMLPQTRGAEKVYYSALRPLFHQGRAKAAQLSATTPTSANSGFSTGTGFPTQSDSSMGYSTGISTHPSQTQSNPFLSQTEREGTIPSAAGIPLPDTPYRNI